MRKVLVTKARVAGLCDNADLCTVALRRDPTLQHTTVHTLAGFLTTVIWMSGGCVLFPRTSDSDTLRRFLLFAPGRVPQCSGATWCMPAPGHCHASCPGHQTLSTLSTLSTLRSFVSSADMVYGLLTWTTWAWC